VRIGYAPDEILAVLEKQSADLAILGTHGRKGFDHLLLGSVTRDVMHRAACNLLVVPPGATLRQESAQATSEQLAGTDSPFVSGEVPEIPRVPALAGRT
jgi:hypothetical protein